MSEDLEGVVYRALAEPVQFPEGDGLTLEGYAAVFNRTAHIVDRLGEYDEVIKPGAFKRSISARTPLMMYQHGRHPLFGQYPLGRIETLREDDRGLFVRARLTDTWLTSPIRDAINERAVTGMSIAFEAPKGKADWSNQTGGGKLRTVREARLFELGPVVGEAYQDTTVMLRSALHGAEDAFPDYFEQERLDIYARLAILEERAGDLTITANADNAIAEVQKLSDTSEELAQARTSDELVDESGTPDAGPADDGPAQPRGPMTSSDRAAYVRRVEMERRGIRAKG
jgi:HK97 family phage prohead protease